MFENFLANGSKLSVILMVYSCNVMIEALKRDKFDRTGLHTPPVIRTGWGNLSMIGSLPCALWPAIYIGLFEGWGAGIGAWVILQLIGAFLTIALKINGRLLGIHFVAASLAYPIGYYLSLEALPT